MDSFLEIFDPPLPPSWTILLNKAYVVTWTFHELHVHTVYETPLPTSPLVNYRKSIFGTYDFQDLYHQGDFPNEKYKFNVELVMI